MTFEAIRRTRRAFLLTAALLCLGGAAWAADVGDAPYDVSGQWLMDGIGYGEKAFVRLRLSLDGTLDIYTSAGAEGRRSITGYDIKLRIDTSRADIKTWTDYSEERLHVSIPLPELRPTMNDPFELPPVRTSDGLIYQVTLTSVSSGKVRIYGYIDLDVIGSTEINSESVIWKQGTTKPDQNRDLESGCGLGLGGALLLPLPLLRRSRRVS